MKVIILYFLFCPYVWIRLELLERMLWITCLLSRFCRWINACSVVLRIGLVRIGIFRHSSRGIVLICLIQLLMYAFLGLNRHSFWVIYDEWKDILEVWIADKLYFYSLVHQDSYHSMRPKPFIPPWISCNYLSHQEKRFCKPTSS